MNVQIFSALRKVNRHVKKRRKERAGMIMSPVRRIEFVSPPKERLCAMTFDDGPTAAPCTPYKEYHSPEGLTSHLLDVLKKHNATATFDVIGSTAENYPDMQGAVGSHFVFGTKYDHYACFNQDNLAGAVACPKLLKRMVEEGNEIANHSYRHLIFGPEYFVYRSRVFFRDLNEVLEDLTRLHKLVEDETGYEIRLARPPHYVDKIGRFGRDTAYTAYAKMCYHYMAASADGGGWLPTSGDYAKDVQAMVSPLENILKQNPDGLSGAVIFQKDGYNMSMETPVADALDLQLSLLADYGYRVVGVEELLRFSPFEDVSASDECFEAIRALENFGYCTGFQNNHFKPDMPITAEQLKALCTKRENFSPRACKEREVLTTEVIKRTIYERFEHCVAHIGGNTRREVAIALWQTLDEIDAKML